MKKGFTLVELIAVVTLLGILLVFSYPKITDISEKKNSEISEAKMKLIETAAVDYMDRYADDAEKGILQNIGDINCISLEDLENENLIPVDISDIKKKYNYVKIVIGNKNSYRLVNAESIEACKS